MASYEELGNNRYRIVVHVGYDATGKRIRRSKTITATGPRELKRKMSEFEVDVLRKTDHAPDRKMSFSEFVDEWRDNYASIKLEPSTIELYEDLLKLIEEYFKKMFIKDIQTFHIVRYFTNEKKEERGQLEKRYNVLMSIFKHATEWGVIKENPMTNVKKPKAPKREITFYDKEGIGELMEAIKTLSERHQLLIKFTLVGGLRRGEVMGIAYDQVDFAKNQIHITRSLQKTKSEGLRLKGTKTENIRTVTFPENLMKELHKYYMKQIELKMKMGNLWKGFEDIEGKEVMLFQSDEYGQPFAPNSVTVFWNRFIKRSKLKKIRFQDLRHSSASLILSEGVNMKVLQKRLGHKDIKTTMNVYSHVTEKDDEKASDVFGDLI